MTYACRLGEQRERDLAADLSIFFARRLNKYEEGYFDLCDFVDRMPKVVGLTDVFGGAWPLEYNVQAFYNQRHVWAAVAHEYNEIVVRELKNSISEYDQSTHVQHQKFTQLMTKAFERLGIQLEGDNK